MSRRSVLVAAGALLFAALGTAALWAYLRTTATTGTGPTRTVLVATREIPAGASLAEVAADSRARDVPAALAADGALASTAGIPAGTVTVQRIARGQQVVTGDLGARAENGIPTGSVQVAARVDLAGRVDDKVRAGDDVEVLASTDDTGPLTVVVARARVDTVDASRNVVVFLLPAADGRAVAAATARGTALVLLRLPTA